MEVECLTLKDLTSPRKGVPVEPEEDGGQSEQKENICTEKKRSTPLKSAESTIPALLINRKGPTPDLAHITPIKHTPLAEPWTPTANLKMLISAASPDIRDREMKKVLFRPIENEKDQPGSPDTVAEDTEAEDSGQFEAVEEEEDADKKPSRKQKSLGLLCHKFLALYPDYPPLHSPIWISLDEVATNLGVERRRIYDIVNVLESLMIVGRIAKNSYTWYGRRRLEATLEDLQRRGRQQGYHLHMELPTEAREAAPGRKDDGAEGDASNSGGNRKDKSLRIMSQKFVMLFLVSKTQTVTLDAAAKILIEESQDSSSHSKYKTKVRRLYDIANVLTSLGLIKKVHVREERGRKPAFKWHGPVEFKNSGNAAGGNTLNVSAVTLPEDFRKAKMARHASFNIAPNSVAIQRLVNSAPSSPRRDLMGQLNQPVDFSKETTSHLQFGNSTNNRPNCQSRSSTLPLAPTQPTLLAPSLHPEHLFAPMSSPHCLAYLPSLSQPSVVMLYRAPDKPDQMPEGSRSPRLEAEGGRKRRREEEVPMLKKKGRSGLEECDQMRAESHCKAADCSKTGHTRTSPSRPAGLSTERTLNECLCSNSSSEPAQPSHYLYVPNDAGLNSLNFLLSAGQPPAGLALPPSSVPTLALPYVLVPSAALSHYPLVANALQQQGSKAQTNLSFSLPAVMSPAHFMVGAAPYGLAAASEISTPPVPSPSTPEQSRLYGSAGAPHSPSAPRQTVSITTPEPLTPLTPKETTPSASKAFFQTPGTLGSVVSAAPAGRRRGSAQRRLDISHPPTSWTCEEME
ncbi:transcription factor E2F7 isoform X2 [Etheostoma spectabile]|uniref:transcription factor E2F7 n=1 Tax=Etheostoma spectabile TaxID=54343 RepID=UPI0013AED50F|nr:transcription factor E2F7-like [Etheostoma spectabile]XP_032367003.1 transcription factor E2F7-like isoform X2 [Etheostoma spectabile]